MLPASLLSISSRSRRCNVHLNFIHVQKSLFTCMCQCVHCASRKVNKYATRSIIIEMIEEKKDLSLPLSLLVVLSNGASTDAIFLLENGTILHNSSPANIGKVLFRKFITASSIVTGSMQMLLPNTRPTVNRMHTQKVYDRRCSEQTYQN